MNTQRKQETENELSAREMEKNQKEKELEQQRKLLEDYEARFGNALNMYENLVNNQSSQLLAPHAAKCELTKGAATGVWAGVGAFFTAAVTAGLAPGLFVLGVIGVGVQYLILDSAQQGRAATLRRLEQEASNLKRTLQELSGQAQSIVSTNPTAKFSLERQWS
jgi:hypothetical protein